MNTSTLLKGTVTLMALAYLQSGCTSVGKEFKYQNRASLKLGETRSSDYREMFGKPKSVEIKKTSDAQLEIVRYLHVYADRGLFHTAALDLEFRNEVLNGYISAGNLDEDGGHFHTAALDVEVRKKILKDSTHGGNPDSDSMHGGCGQLLKQIHGGTSTRSDVLQVMGQPDGMARCPTFLDDFKDKCAKGTEIWVWMAVPRIITVSDASRGTIEAPTVFIVFDKDGIVRDIVSSF